MPSEWSTELPERGWTVVEDVPDADQAEALLAGVGSLRPQYGSKLRHEVTFRPGFDGIQYSQSTNGISPHTEAPGLDPPPRYLALHCHRQARCGGGRTVLTDGRLLVDGLRPALRAEAERREVRFDLVEGASVNGEPAIAAPVIGAGADGAPILRYSYNVMRDGRLEGPARNGGDDLDGIDPFFRELCEAGRDLVESQGEGVLAPDSSLLIFDNWRMLHSRTSFEDRKRHLTRYWVA